MWILLGAFLGFLGGKAAVLMLGRRRHPLNLSQVTVMGLAALMLVAGGWGIAGIRDGKQWCLLVAVTVGAAGWLLVLLPTVAGGG